AAPMQRPSTSSGAAASESVSAAWGNFLSRSRCTDIPVSVRHEAKRSLLNCIGTALGAARHPDLDRLVRLLRPVAGPAQATLIGRSERMDILNAAFVNAI